MNTAETMEFLGKHVENMHMIHNGWMVALAKSRDDAAMVRIKLLDAGIKVCESFSEVLDTDLQVGVFYETDRGRIKVAIRSKKFEE